MPADPQTGGESFLAARDELQRLRTFAGTPAEFWPSYLQACSRLTGATLATLILRSGNPPAWKRLAQVPQNTTPDRFSVPFSQLLVELGDHAAREGIALKAIPGEPRAFAAAIPLPIQRSSDACVATFLLTESSETEARLALDRLLLVSDCPASYLGHQATLQNRSDMERVVGALDLMTEVNAEKRFVAACLAFVNGLATRHQCDRVSLGWLRHGYIRLQAISRTEKFDRHMATIQALELAMEEALDQDEEILHPAPADASSVNRDHEAYARAQGSANLCSVPIRLDDEVIAVLTCERSDRPFSETELRQLRLGADQVARRLQELHTNDRWWGSRLLNDSRHQLSRFVGPEHTWVKVLSFLAAVVLILIIAIRIPYRVEATFILRSDEVVHLTAPFDGYIRTVHIRPGDPVTKSRPLVAMAQDELLLDESAAVADLARYSREAEKARAINALADMRVALALADQSRARLDLVRYRLEQSELKAPFEGVVTEGDLKEKIGAPVKQGETLIKVARTDRLFVEAEVNERDIHEISDTAQGEIAFTSQPKFTFPIQVSRIQASGQPKENVNVFLVRCSTPAAREIWWRPGMSGIAKIHAGKRSIFWILTHRTVDYLRLLLWW